MPASPEFIKALEHHRVQTIAHRTPKPTPPSLPLLLSWIHHDNMLEGCPFSTNEIAQALRNRDDEVVPYLRPLMEKIRLYRDAILEVWSRAHAGRRSINADVLRKLHRLITPDPRDRGGLYRVTSPVHRDYFQPICDPDKIPQMLKRLLDASDQVFDEASDPVYAAAKFHHQLMHIYPYRRNPGTTIRLFTNLLVLSRGYPPILIPSHARDAYYHALNHPKPEQLADVFNASVSTLLARLDTPLGLVAN
ncbi:MAG: Fic family protein [Bradymonadia bacterium]